MSKNLSRKCKENCPVTEVYGLAIRTMQSSADAVAKGSFKSMDDAMATKDPAAQEVLRTMAYARADVAENSYNVLEHLKSDLYEIQEAIGEGACPGPRKGQCQSIGLCALRNDPSINQMVANVWTRPCSE